MIRVSGAGAVARSVGGYMAGRPITAGRGGECGSYWVPSWKKLLSGP